MATTRVVKEIRRSVLTTLVACVGAALLASTSGCASSGATAASHNAQGVERFASGDYDNAIALFEASLEENPNSAEAYYNLGSAYQRKASETGDAELLASAEDAYWAALERNPAPETIVCCYRGLATAATTRGDSQGAMRTLEEWRDRNPQSIEPKLEIAYLLEAQEKDKEAYELLKEIAQQAPEDYRAYYKMGALAERAGDLADAMENANVALKLNPTDENVVQRANLLDAQYEASLKKAKEEREKPAKTPSFETTVSDELVVESVPGQTTRVPSTSAQSEQPADDAPQMQIIDDAPSLEIDPAPAPAPAQSSAPAPNARAANATLGFGPVEVESSTATPSRAVATTSKGVKPGEPDVKWISNAAPPTPENKISQANATTRKNDVQHVKSASAIAFSKPNVDENKKPTTTKVEAKAPDSGTSVALTPSATTTESSEEESSEQPRPTRVVERPRAPLHAGPPNLRAGSFF